MASVIRYLLFLLGPLFSAQVLAQSANVYIPSAPYSPTGTPSGGQCLIYNATTKTYTNGSCGGATSNPANLAITATDGTGAIVDGSATTAALSNKDLSSSTNNFGTINSTSAITISAANGTNGSGLTVNAGSTTSPTTGNGGVATFNGGNGGTQGGDLDFVGGTGGASCTAVTLLGCGTMIQAQPGAAGGTGNDGSFVVNPLHTTGAGYGQFVLENGTVGGLGAHIDFSFSFLDGGIQILNAGTAPSGGDEGGGTVNVASGIYLNGLPSLVTTAVTIVSGFGTSPTLDTGCIPSSCRLTVGSSPGSTGVIGLPTAAHDWVCGVREISTPPDHTVQTNTTQAPSSATFSNYNSGGNLTAWTAGDVLLINCFPH